MIFNCCLSRLICCWIGFSILPCLPPWLHNSLDTILEMQQGDEKKYFFLIEKASYWLIFENWIFILPSFAGPCNYAFKNSQPKFSHWKRNKNFLSKKIMLFCLSVFFKTFLTHFLAVVLISNTLSFQIVVCSGLRWKSYLHDWSVIYNSVFSSF